MNGTRQASVCPDWVALEAARDDGAAGESSWMEALEHRQECSACHEAALAVDPTLLFLDMAPVETSEAEISAMQERVAISRRFSESVAESGAGDPALSSRNGARSHGLARWLAAAAALVFVGIAGLNQPFVTVADLNPPSMNRSGAAPLEGAPTSPTTVALEESTTPSLAEHLEALPLVEGGDVRYELSGGSADYAVLVYTGVDL